VFCKDCHWHKESTDGQKGLYCKNNKAMREDSGLYPDPDNNSLIYSYDEGGCFRTGDYFGCVHFKQKEA
jgi:hypothetical protein